LHIPIGEQSKELLMNGSIKTMLHELSSKEAAAYLKRSDLAILPLGNV